MNYIIARLDPLIFFFIIFLITFSNLALSQDVITMTYRSTEKGPYIKAAPFNEGLYQAVFKEAARRIGLGFEIQRYPKRRAYANLKEGKVDFYPAASFNPSREQFGYFIDNRITTKGGMLLYHDDINIDSISEIKDYILLYNMGGTTSYYKYIGVDVEANILREVPKLSIARAIKILQAKHSDFYAYDLTSMEEYFKKNKVEGIKKHPVYLNDQIDYLIFSKKSKFYQEKPNPNYDSSKELSISNLPYTLDEDSVAYKFQQALKSMQKSGEIDRIHQNN